MLAIYVDDIPRDGSSVQLTKSVKAAIFKRLQIKDLGETRSCLCIEIYTNSSPITPTIS